MCIVHFYKRNGIFNWIVVADKHYMTQILLLSPCALGGEAKVFPSSVKEV